MSRLFFACFCLSVWCADSYEVMCRGGGATRVNSQASEASPDAPKWDLSCFYATLEVARNEPWDETRKTLSHLCQCADEITKETPYKTLQACLKKFRGVCQKVLRLLWYLCLTYENGLTGEGDQILYISLMKDCDDMRRFVRKFTASIVCCDEAYLRGALCDPGFEESSFWLKALLRNRQHMLTPVEECLWADKRAILDAKKGGGRALGIIGHLRVVCGRTRCLSVLGARALAHSCDEEERECAVYGLIAALKGAEPELLECFNFVIKDHAKFCQMRHYDSPDGPRHLVNHLDAVWVDELRQSVQNSYSDTSHVLMQERAALLGQKVLCVHNIFAPLMPHEGMPWEKAFSLVCGAYDAFDKSLSGHVRALLEQGRLNLSTNKDFEEQSHCMMRTPEGPYIASGYYGRIGDFITLAHECGHAVHGSSCDWYPEWFDGCAEESSTFFTEFAAIFSERVCVEYAMQQLPEEEAKALFVCYVEHLVSHVQGAICRDKFEKNMHDLGASRDVLLEDVREAWVDGWTELYGDSLFLMMSSVGSVWPGRIHFFTQPFYEYAYAMAGLFARAVYMQVDQPGFVFKYKTFLQKSWEMSFCDVLKLFDLPNDPAEFCKESLALVIKDVESAKNIVRERGSN